MINENNIIPSPKDKNEEIKILGSWLYTQKANYYKNNHIMTDNKINNIWTKFINND